MTELAGWTHAYSGKVRDLYTSPGQPGRVLVVASDRVSAFDHVLQPGIPGKGALLTKLSLWWFAQLDGVPNHLVEGDWGLPPAQADSTGSTRSTEVVSTSPTHDAGVSTSSTGDTAISADSTSDTAGSTSSTSDTAGATGSTSDTAISTGST